MMYGYKAHCMTYTGAILWLYEVVSKSFRTESNEIYAYLWYYSLRSNTKGYGGKTHYADSQNSDTTAPSGRELYHLQFSLQAASPETFGYTLVDGDNSMALDLPSELH
jgi:hypothetical protein